MNLQNNISINKLSIIIPAYNEKGTIREILKMIDEVDVGADKEVIVIDDGSIDGTADILIDYRDRYKIIFHDRNRGKGAAIRTGLESATGDYIVIQDADLEYDPNDLKKMLSHAMDKNAEVVYGSRRLGKRKSPTAGWSYYLGGIFLTYVTNFLYGTRITDEATCYKMISKKVMDKIELSSVGFEFCPEITAKIARLKIPIEEVSISYNPRSKKEGKKIKKIRDGSIAIWTLIKHRIIL